MKRNRFGYERRSNVRSFEGLERRDLLAADLTGDAIFNAEDVDALVLAIRTDSNDPTFDIDGDGNVSDADLASYMTASHANFVAGDFNLDNKVDFNDFLALSVNFGESGGWADGDANGDGIVGFPDFLALSENFGRSSVRSLTFTVIDGGFGGAKLLNGATLQIQEQTETGDYSTEILLDGTESFTVDLPNVPLLAQVFLEDPNDPFCFFRVYETAPLDQDHVDLFVALACA